MTILRLVVVQLYEHLLHLNLTKKVPAAIYVIMQDDVGVVFRRQISLFGTIFLTDDDISCGLTYKEICNVALFHRSSYSTWDYYTLKDVIHCTRP